MTAFNVNDIPSSVNTLEELAVWSMTILDEIYPEKVITEAPGRTIRQVECAPFYIDTADVPGWFTVARFSLPMAANWRQASKPWAAVQEIGTLVIPVGYRS